MVEMTQTTPDSETPVNPYSLLEAVNRSSDQAHTGWLIFLAIMTYLMVAVAGVTHEAILLETPVQLPILQVNIQLKQFFQFAPVVLVLFHLGILAQLVLLAKKTLEFDHAIRLLETTSKRTHPLRLELHNFFFVQAIAGPHRSFIMSGFLHIMLWLTIVILPVVLLLYMQVSFLPYHNETITWINRIALVFDITMLLLIGVFLMRAETSFPRAFWRITVAHPLVSFVTALVLALVAYLSFFAATVPGKSLDRYSREFMAMWGVDLGSPTHQSGFALPFVAQRSDGTLFGVFSRNLNVTDADLVHDNDIRTGEKTISLRGRDLRYAKLDRTDLRGADLTDANLNGASLAGADLRQAWMGCAELDVLLLYNDRKAAKCPTAASADFTRAKLEGARMSGINISGSKFDGANLQGAQLENATLIGASFKNAELQKASMTGGVQAQGTNFLNASLQGADMNGAQLQFADFSGADMQGSVLDFANFQGALLSDADLEGASLRRAKLQGANLAGAKIDGADLRGVALWLTPPPSRDASGLTDYSDLTVSVVTEDDKAFLKTAIDAVGANDPDASARHQETAKPLLDSQAGAKWKGSPDYRRWQSYVGASGPGSSGAYSIQLTTYLTKLMCSPLWSDGSIATGVSRRAISQQFRGDVVALYDGLRDRSCIASRNTPADVLHALSTVAEQARNEQQQVIVPAPVEAGALASP